MKDGRIAGACAHLNGPEKAFVAPKPLYPAAVP